MRPLARTAFVTVAFLTGCSSRIEDRSSGSGAGLGGSGGLGTATASETSSGTSGSDGGAGGAPGGTGSTSSSSTGLAQGGGTASGAGEGGNPWSGPPGRCRTHHDCSAQSMPQGECIFEADPCFSDAWNYQEFCSSAEDCTEAGSSCFACEQGVGVCLGPCVSDADCKEGSSCGSEARCEPIACDEDADCPANFVCGAGEGRCEPESCATDGDCDGSCIGGRCTSELGRCVI